MNKKIKVLLIAVILPLGIIMPVMLLQTQALDSRVYAQSTELQQRLDQYKAKLGSATNRGDLDRLKLRCEVAQSRLKLLQERVSKTQETRGKGFEAITGHLNKMSEALKAGEVDATKLDTQIAELKTKTEQFSKDLSHYKQSIDDMVAMDCPADPLGMKAALETARVDHGTLTTSATDIRNYVNNVIKPTLNQVKAELQAKAAAAPTADPNQETSNAAQ